MSLTCDLNPRGSMQDMFAPVCGGRLQGFYPEPIIKLLKDVYLLLGASQIIKINKNMYKNFKNYKNIFSSFDARQFLFLAQVHFAKDVPILYPERVYEDILVFLSLGSFKYAVRDDESNRMKIPLVYSCVEDDDRYINCRHNIDSGTLAWYTSVRDHVSNLGVVQNEKPLFKRFAFYGTHPLGPTPDEFSFIPMDILAGIKSNMSCSVWKLRLLFVQMVAESLVLGNSHSAMYFNLDFPSPVFHETAQCEQHGALDSLIGLFSLASNSKKYADAAEGVSNLAPKVVDLLDELKTVFEIISPDGVPNVPDAPVEEDEEEYFVPMENIEDVHSEPDKGVPIPGDNSGSMILSPTVRVTAGVLVSGILYFLAYSSDDSFKPILLTSLGTLSLAYSITALPIIECLKGLFLTSSQSVSDLSTLIVTGLYTYLGIKNPSSLVVNATRLLGSLDKSKASLEEIVNVFIKVIRYPLSFTSWADLVPELAPELFNGKARELLERVREHPFLNATITTAPSLEISGELKFLLSEITDLMSTLRGPELHNARAVFQPYMSQLINAIALHNMAGLSSDTIRQEPVMVCLFGGPGVGKSILVSDIIAHLVVDKYRNRPDMIKQYRTNSSSFVYYKNALENFWSAYRQQMITVYDDLGQGTPDDLSTDAVAGLIALINSAPTCLDMPDVNSKGKINFTSDFVIATTNRSTIHSDNVYSSDAIIRRVHVPYLVVLKNPVNPEADYFNQRRDPTIVIDSTTDKDAIYSFIAWDIKRGVIKTDDTGAPIVHTFAQVITNILSHRDKFAGYAQINVDRRNAYIDSLLTHVQGSDDSPTDSDTLPGSWSPSIPSSPQNSLASACTSTAFDSIRPGFAGTCRPSAEGSRKVVVPTSCPCFSERLYDDDLDFDQLLDYMPSHCKVGSRLDQLKRFMYHVKPSSHLRNMINIPGWNLDLDLEKAVLVEVPNGYDCPYCPSPYSKTRNLPKFPSLVVALGAYVYARNSFLKPYYLLIQLAGNFALSLGIYYSIYKAARWSWSACYSMLSKADGKASDKPIEQVAVPEHNSGQLRGKHSNRRERGHKNLDYNRKFGYGENPLDSGSRQGPEESPMHERISVMAKNNDLQKAIKANMLVIGIADKGVGFNDPEFKMVELGNGIDVANDVCLFPKHFVSIVQRRLVNGVIGPETHDIRMYRVNPYTNEVNEQGATLSLPDFLDSEYHYSDEAMMSNDLILFRRRLLSPISCVRNILHLIATKNDHIALKSCTGEFFGFSCSDDKVAPLVVMSGGDRPLSDGTVLTSSLTYYINTNPGDCGGLILLNRTSPIFGLHAAGITVYQRGYAARIVREEIELGLQYFNRKLLLLEMPVLPDVQTTSVNGLERFYPQYSSQFVNRQLPSTDILKTQLHDVIFPSTKAVPRLLPFVSSNGERIFPYDMATAKVCKNELLAHREDIKLAVDSYFDSIERSSPAWCTTLDYRHAVEGHLELERINLSTSTGFPWKSRSEVRDGKRTIFGYEGIDFTRPLAKELEVEFEDAVSRIEKGERLVHIFSDNLKSEKLPKEKVEKHKCRLFNVVPILLLLLERRYNGAFSAFFMRNKISNGSALGVNPYSQDWDDIVSHLTKTLDGVTYVSAGDYSGFDGSQKPQVHHLILDRISRWYSNNDPTYVEAHGVARRVLLLEVVNSLHLRNSTLYYWNGSLPSGHPLTATLNTIYNNVAFRYAWFVHNGRSVEALRTFDQHVKVIALGDDNVYSTNDPTFNDLTVSKAVGELGLVFTSENKESVLTATMRTIHDVQFLKRSFIRDHMGGPFYVGPIVKETIQELPQWTKRGKLADEILLSNIKSMFAEAALHGPEYYGEVLRAYYSALGTLKEDDLLRVAQFVPHEWSIQYAETRQIPDYYAGFSVSFCNGNEGNHSTNPSLVARRYVLPTDNMNTNLHNIEKRVSCLHDTPTCSRANLLREQSELPYYQAGENPIAETSVSVSEGQLYSEPTRTDAESVIYDHAHALPQEILTSGQDGTLHTIRTFLAKPTPFEEGVLSVSDGSSTFGAVGTFLPMQNASIYLDKLKGIYAIRATLCLRWQVNATRFQQGRYILYHVPLGGTHYNGIQGGYRINAKTFTARQVTQLPHVELDLGSDTEVSMKIPFVHFLDAIPISSSMFSHSPGVFGIYPYSPLQAGSGDTSCGYTLWTHYEDVELLSNTIYQSGVNSTKPSRTRKIRDITAKEQEQEGPLTTGFSLLSKSMSSFGRIPLLSSLAGPAAWAAQVTSGVCAVFGWSKPLNVQPHDKVHLNMHPDYPNTDVVDNVTNLSLAVGNHVEVLPGFGGSNIDELSIDYLKSQYAFFLNARFAAANAAGTPLFFSFLSPLSFCNFETLGTQKIISHTPVSYLGSFFDMFRGGFKFRIKVVKTQFHTGRLVFAFWPFDTGAPVTVNYADLPYVHKTVMDLQEASEWEIDVPYVNIQPWSRCGTIGSMTDVGPVKGILPYGAVGIFVLNPLVAPDTVNQSANMLIEVAGASDLEFAMPSYNETMPCIPSGILPTPQGPEDSVGTASSNPIDVRFSSISIGESITSLRQLLRRPMPMGPVSGGTVYVYPEVATYALVSNTATDKTYVARDFINHLSAMYALTRGGYRVKYLPDSVASPAGVYGSLSKTTYTGTTYSVSMRPIETGGAQTPTSLADLLSNTLHNFVRQDWGVGWNIPFYSASHAKPTASQACVGGSTAWVTGRNGEPDIKLTIASLQGDITGVMVRYGADDLNYAQFTGVPLVISVY